MCLRCVLRRDQISHNEAPAQLESRPIAQNDLTLQARVPSLGFFFLDTKGAGLQAWGLCV